MPKVTKQPTTATQFQACVKPGPCPCPAPCTRLFRVVHDVARDYPETAKAIRADLARAIVIQGGLAGAVA